MFSKSLIHRMGIVLLLASLPACASSSGPASTRPTPHPLIVIDVSPVAGSQAPLPSLSVGSVSVNQSGQNPNYTINAQIPVFQLATDPRVQKLNIELAALVQDQIVTFRQGLADLPAASVSSGSSLDVSYALVSPPGNIISMKIEVEGYFDGAAHPYHLTHSFNYDLAAGADLRLDQLFQPGANYLGVISDYCKAELAKRDIGFESFAAGADSTPDNYRNWNITADGLAITFDEYQVAAYAAGPQIVTVPASALQSILAPGGPLTP